MSKKIERGDIDALNIIEQAGLRDRPLKAYDPDEVDNAPIKLVSEQNQEVIAEEGLQSEVIVPLKPKAEPSPETDIRRKRGKPQSYADTFLKDSSKGTRSAKTAYISQRHHNRISRLLSSIGSDVSLFSFLDNVLDQHFEHHRGEIEELCAMHQKGVYED